MTLDEMMMLSALDQHSLMFIVLAHCNSCGRHVAVPLGRNMWISSQQVFALYP